MLKRTVEGMWLKFDGEGHYPPAREAAAMVAIEDKAYLIYGFQNEILDDIRALDLKTYKWENLTN